MGVRIMEDYDNGVAALYCSTSMVAFGPVMPDRETAERFLNWLGRTDPRVLSDNALQCRWAEFLDEPIDEPEEVDAE